MLENNFYSYSNANGPDFKSGFEVVNAPFFHASRDQGIVSQHNVDHVVGEKMDHLKQGLLTNVKGPWFKASKPRFGIGSMEFSPRGIKAPNASSRRELLWAIC